MRFALLKGEYKPDPWDGRSVSSFATSKMSGASTASIDYKNVRYSGKDGLLDGGDADSSISGGKPYIRELKTAYREIVCLEERLQCMHEEGVDEEESDEDDEDDEEETESESESESEEDENDEESEMRGNKRRRIRSEIECVKLAQAHMTLAEAYRSFMLKCMDGNLPTSLRSLPQKYDIAIRLWENGFELLLERFRESMPGLFAGSDYAIDFASLADKAGPEDETPANMPVMLDHLTDFIYFAYNFYTHLLEDSALTAYTSAWTEQLGDIARYRAAVAAVTTRLARRRSSGETTASAAPDRSSHTTNNDASGRGKAKGKLLLQKGKGKAGRVHPTRLDDDDLEDADTPAGNSIGVAALGDWELEEQATWKTVAREWYHRGLVDTPGTGRLHLHLASLSQDDELRALYHLAKSVSTSHPCEQGHEAMLRFFQAEHQDRRIRQDASAIDLFVHLQGLLYTGTGLDSFDAISDRFFDKLESTFQAIQDLTRQTANTKKSAKSALPSREALAAGLDRDATWIQMAVVAISAITEFGKGNSVFRALLGTKAKGKAKKRTRDSPTGSEIPKSGRYLEHDKDEIVSVTSDIATMSIKADQAEDGWKTGQAGKRSDTLLKALKLAFALLEHTCERPLKPTGEDPAVCPYLPAFLTFIGAVCQTPAILSWLSPSIPWEALHALFGQAPPYAHSQILSVSTRLFGAPLPEEWCIRGMDWTGRALFGRGYWRSKFSTGQVFQSEGVNAYLIPEGEADVLSEQYEGPSMPAHAGGPMEAFGKKDTDDDEGPTSRETVANLRWKRVALMAAWLVRAGSGLRVVEEDGEPPRIDIGAKLRKRIRNWEHGVDESTLDETSSEDTDSEADACSAGRLSEAEVDPHDVDTENQNRLPDGTPQVASQPATTDFTISAAYPQSQLSVSPDWAEEGHREMDQRSQASGRTGRNRSMGKAALCTLPGYTTLLSDVGTLLNSLSAITRLLESRRWIVVIPLVVVTELDKLRSKNNRQDTAAQQAIDYLTRSSKAHAINLKFQTSRGNYLRDLTLRSEGLDDADDDARSEGRSKRTSTSDAVLQAAVWQRDHWLDRRNILAPGVLTAEERAAKVDDAGGAKVEKLLLVSSDKTLRQKAKAQGIHSVDVRELTRIIDTAALGSVKQVEVKILQKPESKGEEKDEG